MSNRPYTSKQMGDACEMLVAAELTLAGTPALKVPDGWPGYDVIAQPTGGGAPQRISVKSRTFKTGGDTFVVYSADQVFDWLAIVLLPGAGIEQRRIYIVPRAVADAKARKDKPTTKSPQDRYWRQDEIPVVFEAYKDNFRLCPAGTDTSCVEPHRLYADDEHSPRSESSRFPDDQKCRRSEERHRSG